MAIKKIPLSDLDWDDLRVFLAVARTRRLSAAARKLGIDHSTVSRRVAQLEATVQTALFTRHRMGLDLNEVGASLLPHVEKMEIGCLSLKQTLTGNRPEEGLVRLAAIDGFASLYLAPRMLAFKQQFPNIEIDLVTASHAVNVIQREADVLLSPFKPTGRGVESEHVGAFSLVLCASAEYAIAHGLPASVDDLGRHQFISYIEDLIQVDAVRWLDDLIADPAITFRSNSLVAQMKAAAAGVGLALLPKFCIAYESELFPILESEIRIRRPVWLSVHQDLRHFPRIKAVESFIRKTLLADELMSERVHLPVAMEKLEIAA